jgi:hypothetical protein
MEWQLWVIFGIGLVGLYLAFREILNTIKGIKNGRGIQTIKQEEFIKPASEDN